MTTTKKLVIAVVALALALLCAIGGTLAYLVAKSNTVTNTFTYGDINITLKESDNLDLKMIPGKAITKDPKVTVLNDSEACWLFVEIVESENFDDFMTYEIADGWTALPGETNVYYREVPATEADTEFAVLKGNKVLVKKTVLKTDLNDFDKDKNGVLSDEEKKALPTLTFTAYAVQKDNVADVATAWSTVNS